MTRIYLKGKENDDLMKLAKKLGAKYIENNKIILEAPGNWVTVGDNEFKIGIKIAHNNINELIFSVGHIRKSCDNFEITERKYHNKEGAKWVIKTLKKIYDLK